MQRDCRERRGLSESRISKKSSSISSPSTAANSAFPRSSLLSLIIGFHSRAFEAGGREGGGGGGGH